MNGDLNHRLGRAGGLAGCGKMLVLRRKRPQRLKPNSLHMSNVRPKGHTLQRSEFFVPRRYAYGALAPLR
jgi:hypothetical protein